MFYILHGDDPFLQGEELAKLTARMGDSGMADLNTSYVDGSSANWEDLYQQCTSIPFLSDRRLVIVTGLLTRLGERQKSDVDTQMLGRLLDLLPVIPETTRLVFAEDRTLPEQHPVLTLALRLDDAYVRHLAKPEGNALTRWVQQRVSAEGGQIGASAAQTLCAYAEDDLYRLQQEILKLVAYTDGQRPITEGDIETLTPNAKQANIFHMVDALGRRDGPTAARIYHHLLDMGAHPLSLLGMITRQFRLMIQIKELAPHLGTPQAIAKALHQSPYPTQKILSQSTHYTMEQLRSVYHKLLDTDVDIKTGNTDPILALDLLIAGLSRVA